MPASTITMPEAKRAAELYRMGRTQTQVAAELGRSRHSIRTALRHLGVQSRPPAHIRTVQQRQEAA